MSINRKVVFSSSENDKKENFFCSCCGFPIVTHNDFESSRCWDGVCHDCYLTFVECRRKSWKDGWRPDKETLEQYIYKKKSILLSQENKNGIKL